jgi:hypothetical protein
MKTIGQLAKERVEQWRQSNQQYTTGLNEIKEHILKLASKGQIEYTIGYDITSYITDLEKEDLIVIDREIDKRNGTAWYKLGIK